MVANITPHRTICRGRGSRDTNMDRDWRKYNPPSDAAGVLAGCPSLLIATGIEELCDIACGGPYSDHFEVAFELAEGSQVVEATVARVRNGVLANYTEPYMRRRDPDCMVIADDLPTDKPTFQERYGMDFGPVRAQTLEWLKSRPLAMYGFVAGQRGMGMDSIVICPANTGFFALGLGLLQGILPYDEVPPDFRPELVIYVAPPFRHTLFGGKQVVVHNRQKDVYELYSYNLYPGPSAKKGVYGALIHRGEKEGWVTAHCATVSMVTPYDNVLTIMHEGASGGGKSEMLGQMQREPDGRLLLGENTLTGEQEFLEMPRSCALRPITDDMALCHPAIQHSDGRLCLTDAEEAWFVRVNHIDHYGSNVALERLTAEPPEPLLFLNVDAVPQGRALIWEHTQDSPGVPCPNPRVILPRRIVPGVISEPVAVDIRSFGVRTPACTRQSPSYGIIGLFHLLPPALAWLWRLVTPRGNENPSIVATEGMSSEGVGSFWPFATGRKVAQANLLLDQFQAYGSVRHILCPNQHIGAWKVGFMPQWIAREYLARRGVARFRPEQLRTARCSVLGYTLRHLHVEGRLIPEEFLHVDSQPEVGEAAYDQGARILRDFFLLCLAEFDSPELAPLGRQIIECCKDAGTAEQYAALIPGRG